MTDGIGILWRRKRDRRFVFGRAAASHQKQPTPLKQEDTRSAPILTINASPQHVSIEVPRALKVAHHQQVSQYHPFGGKLGWCHASTPSIGQQGRAMDYRALTAMLILKILFLSHLFHP